MKETRDVMMKIKRICALLCAALCAAVAWADAELVEFTLKWLPTLATVSYTVDGVDGDALTVSDGIAVKQLPAGARIILRGKLPDGAGSSLYSTVTAGGQLALDTLDWKWYFSDGTGTEENPVKINNANELKKIGQGVAMGVPTEGVHFLQRGDIGMQDAGAWEGIGTYAATPGSGKAFKGVYDGGGFEISNVTFTNRNYAGIFNQVEGGTIKNLTVCDVSFVGAAEEFGGAIVGHAANGATLTGLTARGNFASSDKPATHNVAGIVVRITPATADVKVVDCVNDAKVYGNYTKVGGISILSQNGSHKAVFEDCRHTGELNVRNTAKDLGGRDGVGGIIAYASSDVEIKNCEAYAGKFEVGGALPNAKVGSLVGWAYSGTTTVIGGAAKKDMLSVGAVASGAKATGCNFAVVDYDSNMAEFCADDEISPRANTAYRVMFPNSIPLTLNDATGKLMIEKTSFADYTGEVTTTLTADDRDYKVVKSVDGDVYTYSIKSTIREYYVQWGTDEMSSVWGMGKPTDEEYESIEAWARANNLSRDEINSDYGAAAYLLGMTSVPTAIPTLQIVSIDQASDGWTVTVKATAELVDEYGAASITDVALAKGTVNGKFSVMTAPSLDGDWSAQTYNSANLSFNANNQAVIKVTGNAARFIKAVIVR